MCDNSNTNKNEILFVCGFNTHLEDTHIDIYQLFDLYFEFSDYKITYFRYKTSENLMDVYDSLYEILKSNQHGIILTHSMGSALVMKYLSMNNDMRKIIMLMPLLHVDKYKKIMTYIPFIKHLCLPKCLAIPNNNLVTEGNMCNDTIYPIFLGQLYTIITYFLLSDENLVSTIQKNKNLTIIYAKNDNVTKIDADILEKIKENLIVIEGKHIVFLDSIFISTFFKLFGEIISDSKMDKKIK